MDMVKSSSIFRLAKLAADRDSDVWLVFKKSGSRKFKSGPICAGCTFSTALRHLLLKDDCEMYEKNRFLVAIKRFCMCVWCGVPQASTKGLMLFKVNNKDLKTVLNSSQLI